MISMGELLKGKDFNMLPVEHQDNLSTLLFRVNEVRSKYGRPMMVTSGYRSMEDQIRIYREKGILDPNDVPMKSKHLVGAAVDIADSHQELQRWIIDNIKWIKTLELWFENFAATKTWVHVQSLPYGSWVPGKSIFFMP